MTLNKIKRKIKKIGSCDYSLKIFEEIFNESDKVKISLNELTLIINNWDFSNYSLNMQSIIKNFLLILIKK